MTSSPAPEFDTFIHEFITSHARAIFAAVPPSQDHDGGEPLVFTVYSNFLGNLGKEGPLPASKSSIDALPTVTVTEEEDCTICLTEYGAAGEAKELPCKHRYHSDCIMKWLGIHGSCPVCRYEMPVDEEEKQRRDGGVGWQVMITVTSGTPVNESGGSDSIESNGQSVEDMDIDLGNGMEDLD
ncbi:hypothetical protein L1987_17940 [Smallanthus sonchifolius]|uniref:Uncharacterized protein n=1 Tax=Smallanthus sonchifolius TaxID=185202 RepID=A0ACB9J0E3_9ASTR|nr:hypothetical protein L1987_17940 [Smallanthus sonchifolius]